MDTYFYDDNKTIKTAMNLCMHTANKVRAKMGADAGELVVFTPACFDGELKARAQAEGCKLFGLRFEGINENAYVINQVAYLNKKLRKFAKFGYDFEVVDIICNID